MNQNIQLLPVAKVRSHPDLLFPEFLPGRIGGISRSKFSLSWTRTRLLEGGWVDEQTISDLRFRGLILLYNMGPIA